ncbi:hypothetical protein HGRIS_011546 [Hohenbuehelia grisea]|uniref:Uncharacterized protein n=1 Tax=Hohenbuehelia grisea TaxID=104357 RepID=A0ABR3JVM7_9AGAR
MSSSLFLPDVSSSFPSSTSSAVPTASTSAAASNNPGSGMQRGASYFFGFLITFIALLLIFVGCGVGTRRRFARRRALLFGGPDFDWAGLGSPGVEKEPPVFHDSWFVKGGEDWDTMLPVSTVAIRPLSPDSKQSGVDPTTGAQAPPPPPAQSLLARARHRIAPPRLFGLMHSSASSRDPESNREVEPKTPPIQAPASATPNMLEVTVMIAMPISPAAKQAAMQLPPDEKPLDEYAFGISRVDWKGKDWIS